MAGYGWNLNLCPKRPYAPPPIACRICNHVFMSSQALIEHIESHMADEDPNSRRPQNLISCQRNPFANPSSQASLPPTLPFTPNSYSQLASNFQERNPIFSSSPQMIVSMRPTSQPQISLMGVRNSWSHQVPFPPQLQRKMMMMEDPPSCDFTKPLLQQLEKPFPYKIELKGINDNRNSSDLDMLDLTLKL
ncbi:hypothetical protein MANES_03G163100v8 [Manihot esculenta]|uniref:C2H2-type domain-containing protein n=1 Tax=Manihot esculenta TaxID=3983 RepID=A0A2C9W9J2_MANES|nr:hypothetical protein MANES_03G163100v8 [Manihot esculenta]